ncbi:MAG TPA: hypothetical protein VGS21_05970, partial [Acidimicrobiales bacterium]|nr:hypothetical protein [Acidimicrobiales bacterium]
MVRRSAEATFSSSVAYASTDSVAPFTSNPAAMFSFTVFTLSKTTPTEAANSVRKSSILRVWIGPSMAMAAGALTAAR